MHLALARLSRVVQALHKFLQPGAVACLVVTTGYKYLLTSLAGVDCRVINARGEEGRELVNGCKNLIALFLTVVC